MTGRAVALRMLIQLRTSIRQAMRSNFDSQAVMRYDGWVMALTAAIVRLKRAGV